MKLMRFTDPAEFYRQASPFLLAREADHNLILGLCADLMRNRFLYGSDPPYFAAVEHTGSVVAAALMTPPFRPALSHVEAPEALALLAADLAAEYQTLPGVLGPKPHSEAFAALWQQPRGQTYHLGRAMRIFQLTRVRPVRGVPGRLRRATGADRELLVEWFGAFQREALGEDDDTGVAQSIERWLTGADRALYLWEDGQPVSMAGAGGPTPHGIRISAVFTPPERRRRGYASALVAAASQEQLDGGRRFCFLFTDLGNPTSNHIYQEIGYQPVCDMDEYHFGQG